MVTKRVFLLALAIVAINFIFTACPQREHIVDVTESDINDDQFLSLKLLDCSATALSRPTVIFTFNKKIDIQSIAKSNIIIEEYISKERINDFTIDENSLEKGFSITFTQKLTQNKNYSVSLIDIKDLYGQKISAQTNFYTALFPGVDSHYPLVHGGLKAYQPISIIFEDELDLDESTLTTENILVIDKSTSTATNITEIKFDSVAKKLTFFVPDLVASKAYQVQLLSTILEKNSSSIVPYSFEFFALENTFIKSVTPDVAILSPSTTQVVLNLFDDCLLDSSSITQDSVFICDSSNAPIASTFAYDETLKTLTLNYPSAPFVIGQNYTLVVNQNLRAKNGSASSEFSKKFLCGNYVIGSNFSEFGIEKTYGDDPRNPGYIFVFKDDFNTPHEVDVQTHEMDGRIEKHKAAPDPTKWDLITDHSGFPSPDGTNGWYKASQVKVEDGRLKLFAEEKSGTLNVRPANSATKVDFTRVAGRVQSKEKWGFLYGKFQVKFKPAEPGTWPAIWLLANSERPRDEMDFIEYYPSRTPSGWDSVYWGGCGWNNGVINGREYARVYNNGRGLGGYDFYKYDCDATMTWEESTGDKSDISVWCDIYEHKTSNLVKGGSIMDKTDMGTRYMRVMYPIIEIQLNGFGVSNHAWSSNWNGVPKSMEVDYLYVSQKKTRRYASFIDEFFTLDNVVATQGIRKASYSYPNVEGHNYGWFQYGNQPLYETNLILVDESHKNQPQSIIYKAKNVKDVTVTVYFHNSISDMPWEEVAINQSTGFPNRKASEYANNPNLDFFLEAAPSLSGPWTAIDFDARWDGRDNPNFPECSPNNFKAKYYEKHSFPERTYNYVKVKFPKVGDNWNKILVSKVVLTRYEGTDFADFTIDGEN